MHRVVGINAQRSTLNADSSLQLTLDGSDARPIYVQIMDEIRRALVRGALGPEDPLPSVRELSASLRVNPRTVSQAYDELVRAGVVYVRRGQGTFVAPDVKPDERERPLLAREVARRAQADAWRSGLTVEELMAALRQLESEAASSEDAQQGSDG